MKRQEAFKKWEEIIGEMEAKKSELDTLLGSARQSNEQTTNALNDARSKLETVVLVAGQVDQKLQAIEQSRAGAEQKEQDANSKSDLVSQIYAGIEKNKSEIESLESETRSFYQEQEEKYKVLYKQIEEELKAGATSVNLTKSFADKVGEYRWNNWLWSGCFIAFVLAVVIYYAVITFSTNEIKTVQDVWLHLAFRLPFLAFAVWLAVFFGNRRAESKKLEELYKHKEVMARSFVGYKQTLEGLNDEDNTLLKALMKNLLEAMSENSAEFLNSSGEKHPFIEALGSLFGSGKIERQQ